MRALACDLQAEVSRLKRELSIACEERDILKKNHRVPAGACSSRFAKQSK